MIPRHRPPFGPLSSLGLSVRSLFGSTNVRDLEEDYARFLNVPYAVWLPSARYGITRAVELVTSSDATVYCPVFNCGAVHHAVHESGRSVEFVDCATDSVLVSGRLQSVGKRQPSDSAVVLSEMFGHRFSAADLHQPLFAKASLKVFDMAMAIPTTSDMERLAGNDLAVISFGLGKSLYAGWGGMAFTRSSQLADDLRYCRERDLCEFGKLARCKSFVSILARTAAHEPCLYGHLRRRKGSGQVHETSAFSTASHEWHRPPTSFHISMAVRNFGVISQSINRRLKLAEIYRQNLSSCIWAVKPTDPVDVALSHFSIRVPAEARESVRAALWDSGIDVGTLFPFPHYLAVADEFPRASLMAEQILNLPLSCQLKCGDVLRICDCINREIPDAVPVKVQRPLPTAA